jgi:NhaP-type Na+/H+ or K+/H+ antiporter
MTPATWFLVIGAVLLFMATTGARIKRMPLSTAMVYLGVGISLGPTFADQFAFNPLDQSALLEIVTEVAVLISLSGAGLKLAAPVGARVWWTPFRMATISMAITVGLMALVGMWLLELPLGAAVLLGAILAPTDPVLASDIQVRSPRDDDRVRFSLTGEAGLNDGTAFPMVMLGLGLMGLHELGENLAHWWLLDLLWACTCGLAVGCLLGAAVAWSLRWLTQHGMQSEFMDNFAGLGLIAFSYGLSLMLLGYGFLAVFSAAFTFHRLEASLDSDARTSTVDSLSRASAKPPYMTEASLRLVEQFERLTEVALLILMGGMMFADSWRITFVACALMLLFVVRPISTFIGLIGSGESLRTQAIISWFGIRGIGSFYYLMYAIQHGVDEQTAVTLISVVLVVVAISIVLHGTSVVPIMRLSRKSE